jgi:hypothetical protein
MKKLMFLMILAVAAGTSTMSFAAGSGKNYKHQNEAIGTNQKSTESYLRNSLNYKHQNGEKAIIVKMNKSQESNMGSDYKHHN